MIIKRVNIRKFEQYISKIFKNKWAMTAHDHPLEYN